MKTTITKPILGMVMMLSPISGFCQNIEETAICPELKGTYQIVLPYRMKVQLPITICNDIEQARKSSERAEIIYSDYLKIRIFSTQEIPTLSNVQEIVYEK